MRRIIWGTIYLMGGCAVGPDYQTPDVKVSKTWLNQGNTQIRESCSLSEKDLAWWNHFHDADLKWLIEEMIRANLPIQVALAHIREARSIVTFSIVNLLPTVSGYGAYTRRHRSENTSSFSSDSLTGVPPGGAGNDNGGGGISSAGTTNLFRLGFDAAWELDIFGGLRRAEEAAYANLESVIEDGRAILLTQVAEVAQHYLSLRDNQQQLAILKEEQNLWKKCVRLKRDLFKSGLANEIDVNMAEVSLAQTQAQIPLFETSVKTILHQLALLLGKEPGYLYERLGQLRQPYIPEPSDITLSILPFTLLQQRPDIRRAERDLATATANVGVSIATMFPLVNLIGNYGVESNKASTLFQGKSKAWSYGSTITAPLIDFGRIKAQVETQEALQDQSFLLYKQTILAALGDAETALVTFQQNDLRSKSLFKAWQANQLSAKLTNDRYQAGLNSELDAIQAQINALLVQQDYVKSVTARGIDLVALYKALGGGWDVFETFKNQDHAGCFVLSSLGAYTLGKLSSE